MRNLAEKTQKRIKWLYDIKLNNNVRKFIRKDKETKYGVHENKKDDSICRNVPGSKLENLVYISPETIENLKENNPFKSLNERNIPHFLVFIGEIDHWVYRNTKFELGKIPLNFELELQAAVTKYWIAAGFMSNHKGRMATRFMPDYRDKLDKDNLNFLMKNVFPQGHLELGKNKIDIDGIIKGEDYLLANLLARNYCKYLIGKDIDLIFFRLRKFYWMDGEEKVRYVMKDFENNPTL